MQETKAINPLSVELLNILQHSLGVDKYGEGNQYRNYFVTPPDSSDGKMCAQLVGMELMKDHGPQSVASGMNYFSVTPAGVDAVALQSPVRPKLTRSQQRYREFLNAESGLTFAEWIGVRK